MQSPEATDLFRDAGRLLLAWLLGGCIGWQRESHGHAAGLRTHALVCVASCLLSLLSFSGDGGDRGRVAAQIVTGIGFLGAGVILRRGSDVRGLTTAATVWLVAGIGIAAGANAHFALLAIVTTLLALLTLVIGELKPFLKPRSNETAVVTRVRKREKAP
ncbi:MAG: MgtC/SapB family protein [Armatimonadota bacterium]